MAFHRKPIPSYTEKSRSRYFLCEAHLVTVTDLNSHLHHSPSSFASKSKKEGERERASFHFVSCVSSRRCAVSIFVVSLAYFVDVGAPNVMPKTDVDVHSSSFLFLPFFLFVLAWFFFSSSLFSSFVSRQNSKHDGWEQKEGKDHQLAKQTSAKLCSLFSVHTRF